MDGPVLVVLAGRPGTGKTTLGRKLATALPAAYLRIDAIETAVIRCGLAHQPVGPVGYVVAHEVATSTLAAGVSVVVDAVNPVVEARLGWRDLASRLAARLVFFETVLADEDEHRRRVTERRPDLDGQSVPSWEQVLAGDYVDLDEARDGARIIVDMLNTDEGYRTAIGHLGG